jgi:exonuclease SbcC
MANWRPELAAANAQLREALTRSFEPNSVSVEIPEAAPTPMLLLGFKYELAAFCVADKDPRESYRQGYAFFRKLYEERSRNWDALNLSFVLCLLNEDRSAEIEALCRDVEGNVYFCRKFVIFLDSKSPYDLSRLPFVPLRHDKSGFLRPVSAQTELRNRGVASDLSEAIVVQYRRSPEGIFQDCMEGKFGEPALRTQSAPTFREPSVLPALNRLTGLEICNFRAYRTPQSFDLSGDIVLLYGQNGLGKTSLYDAIDFAATGGIGRLHVDDRNLYKVARHLDSGEAPSYVTLSYESPTEKGAITRHVDAHTDALLNGKSANRKSTLASLTGINASAGADRIENMVSLFRATHLFSQEFPILTDEFSKTSELSSDVISRLLAFEDFVNGRKKLTAICSVFSDWIKEREEKSRVLRGSIAKEREELAKLLTAQVVTGDSTALQVLGESLRHDLAKAGVAIAASGPIRSEIVREWRSFLEVARSHAAVSQERLGVLLRSWPTVQASKASLAINESIQKAKQVELAHIRGRLDADGKSVGVLRGEIAIVEKSIATLQARLGDVAWWRDTKIEYQALLQQVEGLRENFRQIKLASSEASKQLSDSLLLLRKIEEAVTIEQKERDDKVSRLATINGLASKYSHWKEQSKARSGLLLLGGECESKLRDARARLQASVLKRHELQAKQQSAATSLAKLQRDGSELQKLLAGLEHHVTSGHCPACGHDHVTKELLLEEMRNARQQGAIVSSAAQALTEATSALQAADKEIAELQALTDSLEQQIKSAALEAERLSTVLREFESSSARVGIDLEEPDAGARLERARAEIDTRLQPIKNRLAGLLEDLAKAQGRVATIRAGMPTDNAIKDHEEGLANRLKRVAHLQAEGVRRNIMLDDASSKIEEIATSAQRELEHAKGKLAEIHSRLADAKKQEDAQGRAAIDIEKSIQAAQESARGLREVIAEWDASCAAEKLDANVAVSTVEEVHRGAVGRSAQLDQLREQTIALESALDAAATSAAVATRQTAIVGLERDLANETTTRARQWLEYFAEVSAVLEKVQESAVTSYTNKFGPIASILQQRLRSVFGFEDIELKAVEGKIQVRVRRNGESLRPIDYFSQSQQQILMLSLFFTACATQNWSSFSPILLDDPVTHFDDLNSYSFLDLITGLLETGERRQFIISTCEERFFKLAQQKLQHFGDRLKIYTFMSLDSSGPVIEQIRPRGQAVRPAAYS